MVMGNASQEGEGLIFDHLHRCSAKSEGLDQYPQAVTKAHEDFTHQIMASSAAKVETVYGRAVQKRILQMMQCCLLPLWDHFSGVLLVLVYESNFHNAEKGIKFRKAILFVTHPQRMFYEQKGSSIAVRQDLAFEAASRIADLKLSMNPEYYQSKKWMSKVPTVLQLGQIKAKELSQSLSLQDFENITENREPEPKVTGKKFDVEDGEWHSYFEQYPNRNDGTKKLLPAEIGATVLAIKSDRKDWYDPSQFPRAVLEWFKGQKDVLFYYGPVSTAEDIELAFEKCVDIQLNFRLKTTSSAIEI